MSTATRPLRLLAAAVAVCLILGGAWLIAFARSNDGYFAPTAKTYWEFGGTGGRPLVVAALILTLIVVVGLLLGVGLLRRRLAPALIIGAGAISVLTQFVASVALSIGH